MRTENWLDTAVSGIRFGPDRRAVRAELEGHIEDRMAGLRRVFPDIPAEEARDRALSAMGDLEELKKELARVHRPWLGYLWRASQVLLAVMVLLTAWNWEGIGRVFSSGSATNYREQREEYRKRFPDSLEESAPGWDRVLAVGAGTGPVTAGDYSFSVRRASLFRFEPGDPENGGCYYMVHFTLRGTGGAPWALPAEDLGRWVQVRDSRGRLYRGRENRDPEGRSQTGCGWTEHGLTWREYEGVVFLYQPGEGIIDPSETGEFQVEFDNGMTRFSIPIRWRETAL